MWTLTGYIDGRVIYREIFESVFHVEDRENGPITSCNKRPDLFASGKPTHLYNTADSIWGARIKQTLTDLGNGDPKLRNASLTVDYDKVEQLSRLLGLLKAIYQSKEMYEVCFVVVFVHTFTPGPGSTKERLLPGIAFGNTKKGDVVAHLIGHERGLTPNSTLGKKRDAAVTGSIVCVKPYYSDTNATQAAQASHGYILDYDTERNQSPREFQIRMNRSEVARCNRMYCLNQVSTKVGPRRTRDVFSRGDGLSVAAFQQHDGPKRDAIPTAHCLGRQATGLKTCRSTIWLDTNNGVFREAYKTFLPREEQLQDRLSPGLDDTDLARP